MKNFFITAAMLLWLHTGAQVTKVIIQASGLTCSMCSNSINKSLRTLDMVEKVEPNIKNSTFEISFKPGSNVDFDKLKKKVEDAGFSVAAFNTVIHFNKVDVANDGHVIINGMVLHFLNTKGQVLDGDKTIRILDKGFVSSKEFKANAKYTLMDCYKTGAAANCCAKDGIAAGARIYHATI